MNKKFIHLSDLHFRLNWEEDQELVLDAFFSDLEKQLQGSNPKNNFLIFSGDIVQAGGQVDLYANFLKKFHAGFNSLNIPFEQRICIPGNHDVSVDYIKTCPIEHDALIKSNLNELDFNNYISSQPQLF